MSEEFPQSKNHNTPYFFLYRNGSEMDRTCDEIGGKTTWYQTIGVSLAPMGYPAPWHPISMETLHLSQTEMPSHAHRIRYFPLSISRII